MDRLSTGSNLYCHTITAAISLYYYTYIYVSKPIMFYFGENSIHTCQKYQAKGIRDHFKEGYVTTLLLYSLDEQLHHHGKSLQDSPGIPQPSHTSTLFCHVQFNLDERFQLAGKMSLFTTP